MDPEAHDDAAGFLTFLINFFKRDKRPTAIFDTYRDVKRPALAYSNTALQSAYISTNEARNSDGFIQKLYDLAILSKNDGDEGSPEKYIQGTVWTSNIFGTRWAIVYSTNRDRSPSGNMLSGSLDEIDTFVNIRPVSPSPLLEGSEGHYRLESSSQTPRASYVYPKVAFTDDTGRLIGEISKTDGTATVATRVGSPVVPPHLDQEAKNRDSENFFELLAEAAPLGCAILSVDGNPLWVNQAYLDLTGLSRADIKDCGWFNSVLPDDQHMVQDLWEELINGKSMQPFEHRITKPWSTHDGSEKLPNTWILSYSLPELDKDGGVKRILVWLADISHQKWSQQREARTLRETLDRKLRNEKFIDMTFHELRNPLSAILQSADRILSLTDTEEENVEQGTDQTNKARRWSPQTQDDIIDTAQTIVLCAEHQRKIVDDMLTLSKLDSHLLHLCLDAVDPQAIVDTAVRMFDSELADDEIELWIKTDKSYKDASISLVLADPSRVLQVLINLLTNAIKFTRNRQTRVVTITIAAAITRPTSTPHGILFLPQKPETLDIAARKIGGFYEEEVYLTFAVEDTGPGLSKDEIGHLFSRFSQASFGTYKEYGGSGLGLYISRVLTELQDGQIGVKSEVGKGSTFAFYIKAQRCSEKPDDETCSLRAKLGHLQRPKAHRKKSSKTIVPRHGSPETSPRLRPPSAENEKRTRSANHTSNTGGPDEGPIHVLLVEDNKINQKVLAQQLRHAGCQVSVADHGLEALAIIERSTYAASEPSLPIPPRHNPDDPPIAISVVLMDLEMPVMDGLTCIKKIREMQEQGQLRGHIPVIAVTANARRQQVSVAMERGMDLVVTKPCRVPELLPAMTELVERLGSPKDSVVGTDKG